MRLLPIAGAIALFAATPARADGVGVVGVSVTSTDAATVRKAVAAAVGPGRRVVDDAVTEARGNIMAGAVPAASLERFRRVREQIDEAWRAYLRVQVDFAASRLAAARTDAESLVALPTGALLYADASLRLGAVLAHLGRTQEAQAILALALALDPDRQITLAEFSPDIVAAVDAVRGQPRVTKPVRITSSPVGATISVDGRDIGRAPLTTDLAVGQHVIVARMPLMQSHAEAFAVDDGDVALSLEPDLAWRELGRGAQVGSNGVALVDATTRYADLDDVVLVADTDRRGGPALLMQRCAGLPAKCTAVVEVGYEAGGLAAAAREAWTTVRAADLRYPPSVFGDERLTGKHTDNRCRVCRSPVLWGGVGVAAIVATVAIIAVVSSSRPPPVVGVDPTQF
jgi:hypothetical protein